MSDFFLNLVRHGAGLIEAPVEAPAASAVGLKIGRQRGELSDAQGTAREEHSVHSAGGDAPLRASNAQEVAIVATDSSAPDTFPNRPATVIQRVSATLVAPASADGKPSLGAPPASTQALRSVGRETRGASPGVVGTTRPPDRVAQSSTVQGTTREIQVERGEAVLEPTGETLGPPDLRSGPVSAVAFDSPAITRAPKETPASPSKATARASSNSSAGSLRTGTKQLREPAPLSPRIQPAPDDSHAPFQFPKVSRALASEAPSKLPIHVRIGRIEVVPPASPTASTTTSVNSAPRAGLGFKSYSRVRNYRY